MTTTALTGKVALVAGATPRRRARHRGRARRGRRDGLLHRPHDRASGARSTTGPRRSRRPPSSSTPPAATGIAVAVDHLEPEQVEALVARIDAEQGRLDVLVNDIWGGEKLFEWNTPVWEHDLDNGLRMLRLAIDTHLITSHFALPLLIRRPGGLVVEMTDGTREYNAAHYRLSAFYDLAKTAVDPARVRAGQGARAARLHGRGADAGLDALGDDARELRRHRGELARRGGRQPALRRDLRDPALRRPRGRRPRRRPGRRAAATAARSRPAASRASTASPTSTAPGPTAGATWSRSRTRASRPTRPATADRLTPRGVLS